jgi:hypothetical protein
MTLIIKKAVSLAAILLSLAASPAFAARHDLNRETRTRDPHIGEIGDGVRAGSWSGYSIYPYDPDCNDFFFRHPDYRSRAATSRQ